MHCIEKFFIVQHFWTICTCLEKQNFPWKFSLYWLYTFYIQDLWATCACPEKQSVPWIHLLNAYFLSFRIFEQFALALKNRVFPENFHWIEIFFVIQEFWATCTCPKTEFDLKIFKPGGGSTPASYAYGIEYENTIFYIAWKMTVSKRHE